LSQRGYRSASVPYRRLPRTRGDTKFNFRRYLSYAIDGIIGDNMRPLRLSLLLGLVGICFTFIVTLIMLTAVLGFHVAVPRGLLSTVLILNIYGTLNLIILGILGEYLGRIFNKTTRLSRAIISDTSIKLLIKKQNRK